MVTASKMLRYCSLIILTIISTSYTINTMELPIDSNSIATPINYFCIEWLDDFEVTSARVLCMHILKHLEHKKILIHDTCMLILSNIVLLDKITKLTHFLKQHTSSHIMIISLVDALFKKYDDTLSTCLIKSAFRQAEFLDDITFATIPQNRLLGYHFCSTKYDLFIEKLRDCQTIQDMSVVIRCKR